MWLELKWTISEECSAPLAFSGIQVDLGPLDSWLGLGDIRMIGPLTRYLLKYAAYDLSVDVTLFKTQHCAINKLKVILRSQYICRPLITGRQFMRLKRLFVNCGDVRSRRIPKLKMSYHRLRNLFLNIEYAWAWACSVALIIGTVGGTGGEWNTVGSC